MPSSFAVLHSALGFQDGNSKKIVLWHQWYILSPSTIIVFIKNSRNVSRCVTAQSVHFSNMEVLSAMCILLTLFTLVHDELIRSLIEWMTKKVTTTYLAYIGSRQVVHNSKYLARRKPKILVSVSINTGNLRKWTHFMRWGPHCFS